MKKPRLNTPGACRKAQIAALTNSLEIKRQARAQRLDRAADALLQQGYRQQAERLSRFALELREATHSWGGPAWPARRRDHLPGVGSGCR
jgi:hypothetical protein